MKALEEVIHFIKPYIENKWINLELAEVEDFFSSGKVLQVEKGEHLISPKTVTHNLCFNCNGIFRYYFRTKKGGDHTKHFVWKKEFFAPTLPDFIVGRPNLVYCQALVDSTIVYWNAKSIFLKADANPIFYKLFFLFLAHTFQHKDQKEMDMYEYSAAERYEKFLEEYPGITNQIPLQYIASYLDMKPETLSRIRSQF